MTEAISDLGVLLRSMRPTLRNGAYVFCVVPHGTDVRPLNPIGVFHEDEGTSLVVEESAAVAHGLASIFRAAWITLTIHSALNAVGLTAAVSRALADAGISCNVVAAAHHDHLFVPVEEADRAMLVLERLSGAAIRNVPGHRPA